MEESVKAYKRRRASRRAARLGISTIKEYDSMREYRMRRLIRLGMNFDADDENENNSGDSGGHGNTKLPFGLCKRFGIEIQKSWTPRDAWAALKDKGITPDGAFKKLEEGKDPGEPESEIPSKETESPPPPKEPKTTATFPAASYPVGTTPKDQEYDIDEVWYSSRDKGWVVRMVGSDGVSGILRKTYRTKDDMLSAMKEAGVEEFVDPETAEILDLTKMEFPEVVYRGGHPIAGYTDITIGMRDGEYTLYGTDLEGKKKKLADSVNLANLKRWMEREGISMDVVKESPAFKKSEKGRLAWMTSDKKEYVEEDGVRYGDLRLNDKFGDKCLLNGTDENGEYFRKRFETKHAALEYLKSQGVERIRVGEETMNPTEYEPKPIVATINGKEYSELYYTAADGYGGKFLQLRGVLPDGETRKTVVAINSLGEFKKRMQEEYGVDPESIKPEDDEAENLLHEMEKKEAEEKEYKQRFEKEKVVFNDRGTVYEVLNPTIEKDRDGDWKIKGRDSYGREITVYPSSGFSLGHLAGMVVDTGIEGSVNVPEEYKEYFDKAINRIKTFDAKAEDFDGRKVVNLRIEESPMSAGEYHLVGEDRFGGEHRFIRDKTYDELEEELQSRGKNIEDYIKDDRMKKDYEDYKKFSEEFEKKAVKIGDRKYSDITIDYDYGSYSVKGKDKSGRSSIIYMEDDLDNIKSLLDEDNISLESVEKDSSFVEREKRLEKIKKAIDSGEYHRLGGEDQVYKDLNITRSEYGDVEIEGIDIDDNPRTVRTPSSIDDAIEELENAGIQDYVIKYGGKEYKRPSYGMYNVQIERKPDGGYLVYADTKRFGKHEIMYESPDEESCRNWLKENGVDEDRVRTKGMNPNDDVKRTHTMTSLKDFDEHRANAIERYPLFDNMTDSQKKETAEMLTTMFDEGAYRMNRSDHFQSIVEDGFKNLLETGTSGGATSKEGRRITGEKTFGHPYDIPAKEAERYGFWGVDNDEDFFYDADKPGYGKIGFKFKKDRVKDRATYTMGDSLDAGRPLAGYAGDKPTIEGMSALGRSNPDVVEECLRHYRDYKAGNISFHEFQNSISNICEDGYVECQYHGPLTIEDVESITFPKGTFIKTFAWMNKEERARVVTKLKKNGIILNVGAPGGLGFENGYDVLKEEFGEDYD